MEEESTSHKNLWCVFNRETGAVVERFGRHGSDASAKSMLEEFLDAFDVDVRVDFEIRQLPHSQESV